MTAWLTGGLAAMCLVFATALPARADSGAPQSATPDEILGVWSFKTVPYRNGQCVMTGTMRLSPSAENGLYGCELTAMEMCSVWGQAVVRQSCQARRFGNQLSIRSSVEEILDTQSHIDGFQLSYLPDNFALTVQNASRMYGSLISAISAPVEFRRTSDGIS